ncbi:TPA: hypothetical protein MOX26_004676 [Salmonella enterica subsp. enterica serovar Ball]|nr:hypothetical protein [Salmonella enterica subsp. salamae]HCA3435366.1 hypothetical protein [Salmonella enterica subsp. enterica serovar Ball]HCA3488641.1 hypothetical protein [Salmonella enterica subsp. enterica serovar Ball]HCA3563780.1 hypothetical protein [Salmonella enterica subsp. enterica serovar Ball]HCA3582183.1 hypothetical protein [Salmonella enterica subsp. enterica serovar Ball]
MQSEELTGDERTLVVVALQALHRQRISAYNSTLTACKAPPADDVFGLHEVQEALRRIGAAPVYR